jgi:D-alanyl-D-alanine carboxypeptidase (penicillin-binding protein 5/6)
MGEAAVQSGAALSVPLRTQAAVFTNLPRAGADGVELTVRYRGPVEAPIAEGDRVATLSIAIAGQEPHEVALVAADSVPKANAWQRLRNGVVGLFW